MARLLIVSEDIVKIQTFGGRLGSIFAKVYQEFLKIKIGLVVARYRHGNKIVLLASDSFRPKSVKVLSYSRELSRARLVQLKRLAWQTIEEISRPSASFHSIPLIKLWENKLAVRLLYDYLIYWELIERLMLSKRFDRVIILDQSLQGKLSRYWAAKFHRPLTDCSWPNLNFIKIWLFGYFRRRELTNKLQQFKKFRPAVQPQRQDLSGPILLGADFHRHLRILGPLYAYLKSRRLNPCLVTDNLVLANHLKHYNISDPDCAFLENFVLKDDFKKQPLWREKIRPSSYLAKVFWPEVVPIIKYGLILSRLYLAAADNLIKTVKPRSIVVTGDVRLIEISLALLAKKYHLPSITVSPRTIIFNEEPYRYDYTDFIVVPGENSRDQLIKLGVVPERVFIGGDIYLDHARGIKRTDVRERLGIKDPNKKIILLISFRPNPKITFQEKREFIRLAQKAVVRVKNAVLVIKPHPTEKRYRLLEELKKWQIQNVIVADNNQLELFDLLAVSSVVLQTWSMTGLEAITFNRRIIIINPTAKNYDEMIPYVSGGGVEQAKSMEELVAALQSRKGLARAKKFAGRYIRRPDGKACQRITDLLLKVS